MTTCGRRQIHYSLVNLTHFWRTQCLMSKHDCKTLVDFQLDAQNSYLFTYIYIYIYIYIYMYCCGAATRRGSWPPHSWVFFLDHTQRRTTVSRTHLDEWSTRRRDLYLTTHNPHNRKTSMPPVGIEPTISVGERPQTYALDHAATGTGYLYIIHLL